MSIEVTDYLQAAMHVPLGGRLTILDVGWEDYLHLLKQLDDRSHVRVSYNHGRMEIMSPSNKHEKLKNLINSLVNTICYELNIDWLSLGSVTLKQDRASAGAKADDCFYFKEAINIIRKDRLDLAVDPPPDIVVEIDLSNDSIDKLDIYAKFGVPEIWRYARDHVEILKLTGGAYSAAPASQFFPMLTGQRITEFISECESVGQLRAQQNLRKWLEIVRAQ